MENNENNKNPLIQGDHSSIAVKDLNNNVDNHTDSHDVVTHNTHNNTVNQNSSVVYNGSAATEKLLSERREEYRVFCQKNIVSRVISRNTRIELNEMSSRLQLDQSAAEEIERSVLSKLDSGTLSHTDRITLNIAIEALHNGSAKDMVDKLTVLADKTENEEVQYYANLSLAIYDPRKCAQRYEQRQFDSYWQTFWAYLAYKRNGNNQKAEQLLTHLTAWADQPDDQVTLLSGAGYLYDYFAANGSDSLKRTALGYLNSCCSLSPILDGFVKALQYLCSATRPLHYTNSSEIDPYLTIFGAKAKTPVKTQPNSFGSVGSAAATPAAKSIDVPHVTDPKVYEIAQAANRPHESTPSSRPISQPVDYEASASKQSSGGKGKYVVIGIIAIAAFYFMFRPDDSSKDEQPEASATTEIVETPSDNTVTTTSDVSKRKSEGAKAKTATSANKSKSSSSVNDSKPKQQESNTAQVEAKSDEATNIVVDTKPKVSEIEQLTSQAQAGDARSAYILGNKYFNGDGVKKNNKAAFNYFSQSASSGSVEAMYMVGLCYRMGRGVSKNIDQAKQWWTKAASHGHRQAAEELEELKSLM